MSWLYCLCSSLFKLFRDVRSQKSPTRNRIGEVKRIWPINENQVDLTVVTVGPNAPYSRAVDRYQQGER